MNAEQVIKTLKTNPEFWQVIFQNTESIVFAWGDYRFTRLSDRFNCAMMLNSKHNKVNINWSADDPFISELYMGLVYKHLRGYIKNKS
ncbi:hypothetical protein I4641_05855 [Waterburya agarophytonicola K14]|uniref:Uncharacterized protein n=1 Tax=Waterburya agarophytonicola KI4 TaxID=2874699 RepID=A0A964FF07_9CYAN|nr:hypothetical protein [Waterburya agarophytonicola]MCC0176502.1 hypothetical protein [Waterburya agarophytonicola KI4]